MWLLEFSNSVLAILNDLGISSLLVFGGGGGVICWENFFGNALIEVAMYMVVLNILFNSIIVRF